MAQEERKRRMEGEQPSKVATKHYRDGTAFQMALTATVGLLVSGLNKINSMDTTGLLWRWQWE